MKQNESEHRNRGLSKKVIWLIAGALIVLLLIVAAQGFLRGASEAVGVTPAAPGDDNARPAPETVQSERR